jgi:hypothetical protein
MIGPFDYQERISTCAQWAERASNDRAKEVWKEMERFWRQRAIWAYLQPQTPLDPDLSLETESAERDMTSIVPASGGGPKA